MFEIASKKYSLTTKSGVPITLGAGSGTKWKIYKSEHPELFKNGALCEELVQSIVLALQNGYNHIDTAEVYATQSEVGAAIKKSGVERDEFWITDKYNTWRSDKIGPYESLKHSLKTLNLAFLDSYLLHSPFGTKEKIGLSNVEAWLQLVRAKKEGLVRYIGVSNFSVDDLEEIIQASSEIPYVNQIEFHPFLQNQTPGIYDYCQKNNILIEAYGPLSPIFRDPNSKLGSEIVPHLATKYGKTYPQILLRWALQKGVLPITTSSKIERIREALDVFDFELSEVDEHTITEEGNNDRKRFFFHDEFGKYDK